MYQVSTPEVVVLKAVREHRAAAARLERMLAHIHADHLCEVDEADLAELITARGWEPAAKRTGQYRMNRSPALIFGLFRFASPEELHRRKVTYPVLARHMLLGQGAWTYRDHTAIRRQQDCICQSAWELHCAFGCLHACDYCHVPPYYVIMLNLEDFAARVRDFGETIPHQKLYKFDNQTDTIPLEPEYGASAVMVKLFAEWPGRYLLLYTKSDNVEHLLGLEPRGHTLISWSLNCRTAATHIEKGTPPVEARIRAMRACQAAGYHVRCRISPMCPVRNWRAEYAEMIDLLLSQVTPDVISIDVLGWMSAAQMQDALDLSLFEEPYAAEVARQAAAGVPQHGKHLFPHALRADLLRFAIGEIKRRRPNQPVSLCVETAAMWQELGGLCGMTPEHYACCCGPTSVPGHPLLAATPDVEDK